MTRIAVLVSGGGTNLQALIDTQESEGLGDGELSLVVSSVPDVFALERAEKAGIKSLVLDTKNYAKQSEFDASLSSTLSEHDIGLVVLAGFLCVIGQKTLSTFENRIINVHPSLIPSFCGKGFYGLHVHKAALEKGVKVTGATVHFVNNEIDGGKIILQKAVDVLADDTPQTLQQRVMKEAEWVILPKAVRMFCNGEIK
ncbi:MAG: phosphoribosylglycinamide formyltransferase [Treponema sp.]|jgi:phosphoribosylglycinamide formyltransferase-1|nr:phosphoribosylglycinamide formyltransferase [Treponema sp.]